MNKKWKKFNDLTGDCYLNMAGAYKDDNCWNLAFELLKEIILEERKKNPEYASELETIDEVTDYHFDIQGWLEDYLDELEIRDDYETVFKVCSELFELFDWPEYTGSDFKFRIGTALKELGRWKEASEYCSKWLEEEPENIFAASSAVYAYMEIEDYASAEELVNKFLTDELECNEENDIMFNAASTLYSLMGKKKEKKRIDKAMKEYEEYLEKYWMGNDDEDDFMDEWDEDDLPFS